jgi:cholesterol 7-dehydrogenase
MVFVWYDIDGNPPAWEVPRIDALDSATASYHGCVKHHVLCHIQDIPENGPDSAHLNVVHEPFAFPFGQPFLTHTWAASWEPAKEPENKHLANIVVKQGMCVFGKLLPFGIIDAYITQVGPSTVQMTFHTPFGRVWVVETLCPQRPYQNLAMNTVFAEPWVPRFVAKIMLTSLAIQVFHFLRAVFLF